MDINFPTKQRRSSVSFRIEHDDFPAGNLLISDKDKSDAKEFNETLLQIDIAVQTDSDWLEQIRKEWLASFKSEMSIRDRSVSKKGSRPPTLRSQATRRSGSKSKRIGDSSLEEKSENDEEESIISEPSLPVYPEMQVNDEFGVALYSSSDEFDDEEIDFEKITTSATMAPLKQIQNEATKSSDSHLTSDNIIPDAGLPNILKPVKELGSLELKPSLNPEELLAKMMTANTDNLCEFCKKPIVPLTNVKDQIASHVDQTKLFCCQEFRDLLEFAIAQKEVTENFNYIPSQQKLIDVSPHKSYKSESEAAEARARSERRIRERILARQQAALLAAQMAREKTKTNLGDNDVNDQSTTSLITKQLKVINYQLSSFKFMEDGWTVLPPLMSNEELIAKADLNENMVDLDYTASINEIFGQLYLAEQSTLDGVIRQYYNNGELFIIIFPDGTGSVYYPSGNLALIIIREYKDGSVSGIVRDDFPVTDANSKILGVVSTKGNGTLLFSNGAPRIVYDMISGVEYQPDGSRKRNWYWDGNPHTHAPPFQPIFLSLNRFFGVRISSRDGIFLNFFGVTRQLHINFGFRTEISAKLRQKLLLISKLENDKLHKPLSDLKRKVMDIIKRSVVIDNSPLVSIARPPLKPVKITRSVSENKSTVSLSLQ